MSTTKKTRTKKGNRRKLGLGDAPKEELKKKFEDIGKPVVNLKNVVGNLKELGGNLKEWNESFRKDGSQGSRSRFNTNKKDSDKKDSKGLGDKKGSKGLGDKKDNNQKDNNQRPRTKAQLMAIQRKKDGLKIKDVVEKNKDAMRERARERNRKFKERNKK